jgi:hypothetical protein
VVQNANWIRGSIGLISEIKNLVALPGGAIELGFEPFGSYAKKRILKKLITEAPVIAQFLKGYQCSKTMLLVLRRVGDQSQDFGSGFIASIDGLVI